MQKLNLSLNDAYDFVKRKKSNISPNFNFMGQLLDFERTLGLNSPCDNRSPSEQLYFTTPTNHNLFQLNTLESTWRGCHLVGNSSIESLLLSISTLTKISVLPGSSERTSFSGQRCLIAALRRLMPFISILIKVVWRGSLFTGGYLIRAMLQRFERSCYRQ